MPGLQDEQGNEIHQDDWGRGEEHHDDEHHDDEHEEHFKYWDGHVLMDKNGDTRNPTGCVVT